MIPFEALQNIRTIICHENSEGVPCPDGVSSAILLRDAYPNADVRFVSYGPSLDGLVPSTGMLMCDISPEPHHVQPFIDAGAIVLDHHDTRREVVARFGDRGVFGKNTQLESGAVLAFREIWLRLVPIRHARQTIAPSVTEFNLEVERAGAFAHLAAVRDTWQSESADWTKACAQAAALCFYDWETFASVHHPFGAADAEYGEGSQGCPALSALLEVGVHLEKKRRVSTAKLVKECRGVARSVIPRLPRPITALVVNVAVSADTSDLAEIMTQHPDHTECVDMVVGYRIDPRGMLRVSMRSHKGGVDVAKLAEVWGGGGHRESAGMSLRYSSEDAAHPEDILRNALFKAVRTLDDREAS